MSALRAACVAVAVLPSLLTAQTIPVTPGAKVRVTAPALQLDHAEGRVSQVHGDTLVVAMSHYRMVRGKAVIDSASYDVPLSACALLEVATRRPSSASKGAIVGLLVGAGAGLAIGTAVGKSDCTGEFFCTQRDESMAMGFLGGAAIGAVTGALAGATGHHDVWVPAPLPRESPVALFVGRSASGERRLGLGVALRF